MKCVEITPKKLTGKVKIPSSKSFAHRFLIASALAKGSSLIDNIYLSKDVIATAKGLENIGAIVKLNDDFCEINGEKCGELSGGKVEIDCFESGSTLRFLIPIVAALGLNATFFGAGKLPERPIDIYIRELSKKGINFDYNNTLPFSISGKLQSGTYNIEGDVSSQFITGLLFALPILNGDSRIVLLSELQSKPYIDITIDCLKKFGIEIVAEENSYFIKGGQEYSPCNCEVEGDYSQSAFFLVANALSCEIDVLGLQKNSLQGDKKILEIIRKISYNKIDGKLESFCVDGKNCPDIVPILAVLASFCNGRSIIKNVSRLRIKESDRLTAIVDNISKLGGAIFVENDQLVIDGVDSFHGGKVNSYNDHRIAMAMAIAAVKSTGKVTIIDAECVEKSYPNFFEDYVTLGGEINVFDLGE